MGRRGGRVFLKQDSRDDEEEKRHKTREDKGLLKDKSVHQLHNQKWNLDAEAIWTCWNYLCVRRGGGAFWNTNFPKCPLRCSLPQADLFAIFTVSSVSISSCSGDPSSWCFLGSSWGGRGIVWQSFPQTFCVLLPLLRRLCGKIDNLAPCGLEKTRYWFRV